MKQTSQNVRNLPNNFKNVTLINLAITERTSKSAQNVNVTGLLKNSPTEGHIVAEDRLC
jgi:hypothetical protein